MHVAFDSTAGVFPKLSNFINNLNPNSASRMKIHDRKYIEIYISDDQ